MFRWFLTVALCFFLVEGSRTAWAQSDGGKGASLSSGRAGAAPAGRSGSGASVRPSPARSGGQTAQPGRSSVKSTAPGRSNIKNTVKETGRPALQAAPLRGVTKGSSGSGHKPGPGRPGGDDRPGGNDRPGRPGPDGKPGGHWDRPGKPGGDWNQAGRPDRPGHKPHRPRPDRWDNCRPYCYGPIWYSGYDYDDLYEDYDDRFGWEESVSEPITYFSPGQFEFFEDPRLNWAAEGGLGSSPASPPPPGARPASPPSRQTESDLRQYEQMMKAWR